MATLIGKHVVITGATRGLGRSIAEAFHHKGARVSLFARNLAELKERESQLGDRVSIHAGDITKPDDIRRALNHFRAAFGPVEVLVNNAGVGSYKPFTECDVEDLAWQIDVNFTGLVRMTHAVTAEMIARKRGTLIHIASDLARKPLANMAVYTATKHALAGFSQSLARELKQHHVRSILINPGIINTHFGGGTPKTVAEDWQLTGDSIAEVVAFAASRPDNVLMDEVTIHPMGQDF